MWYHNNILLKNTEIIRIDIDLNRFESTLTILCASQDHEGIYQCKAVNEMSTNVTRAKFDLCSMSTITTTTTTTNTTKEEHIEHKSEKTRRARKIVRRKVEVPKLHKTVVEIMPAPAKVIVDIPKSTAPTSKSSSAQKTVQVFKHTNVTEEQDVEIHEEIEEIRVKIYKELITEQDIATFKMADEVNEVLHFIEAHKFGTGEMPLRELATIGYLVQRGITVTEITHLYNADSFPALKNPESQAALVQLVEREGHGKLISEVLTEETVVDDEHMFASTVGFRAFMRMIQQQHVTIEEVIANFKEEDFIAQEWQHGEVRERLVVTTENREYVESRAVSTGK